MRIYRTTEREPAPDGHEYPDRRRRSARHATADGSDRALDDGDELDPDQPQLERLE